MNIAPRNTLLATTSLRRCVRRVRPASRHLATQPPHPNLDPSPSASTQDLLDRLAREAQKNAASGTPSGRSTLGGDSKPYVGSVGPFPMGVGLGSNIRTKDWKKWKDLGVGGKGMGMCDKSVVYVRCLRVSISGADDYANGKSHGKFIVVQCVSSD